MLENFSVGAQRVVSLAAIEARRLDHPRVGTEHLLLGLLLDGDSEGAATLRAAGANIGVARHKVVEAVGDLGSPDGEELPFTPRAQRALERAGRFSRKDREPEVDAGHVLLGVLDVEGLACQVLRGLGVDIVRLRADVAGERPDPVEPVEQAVEPAGRTGSRTRRKPSAAGDRRPAECPHCRASLDDTLAETSMLARGDDGATIVSVLHCTACGETLGFVRPDQS